MALKCLVFDCDGVILDSVPVKTRAFAVWPSPTARRPATASSCTIPCTAA